ncbi:hypothetical protein HYPGJ_31031 [Hyphomicrobium sp. GJ21]|nr:hypothetical protein HYPGJ_31031 [Hyphomicrobium sp. GJ21]
MAVYVRPLKWAAFRNLQLDPSALYIKFLFLSLFSVKRS